MGGIMFFVLNLNLVVMSDLSKTLRTIYMYLVALISVVVFVIGAVNLINTTLETWVFPTDGWDHHEDPVIACNDQAVSAEKYLESVTFSWESTEDCVAYYEEQNAKERINDRNRDFAFGISMTVVSLPIWLLHMWFIKRDKKRK